MNTTTQIFKFILTFIVSFTILYIVKIFTTKKLQKLSTNTNNKFLELLVKLIKKINIIVFIIFSLLIGSISAQLIQFENLISKGLLILFFYYGIIFSQEILKYFITKKETADNKTSLALIHKTLKFIIWVFATLMLLQNFGINITSIMAGLGIAGIAFAFAIQNILSDIFSYFTIHFDKPFKEGDFINIGNEYGTVKKIGLKSTRIENMLGDEIICSNKDLTETRIHNYKKMEKRRNIIKIGVEYDTSIENLEKIKPILTDIAKEIKDIELDNIVFDKLNDSSLDFKIIYYVLSSDYNKHLKIKECINFEIIKKFKYNNINFAYNSQTIYLKK